MIRFKTLSLLLLIIITSFISGGCNDENTIQPKPQPLVLQGQAYTFDSENGTIWNGAQEIGVFLIDFDKKTIIEEYANLKYFADNRTSSGYFVPEGEPVYLKEQQKVNAIAYYPYKDINTLTNNSGSQYLYRLDLSNQKNLKPDAFLYADNAKELSSTNYKATLELRPVLSMVKLTFTQSAGISEDRLKKMTLKLKGMPSKADFDLLLGDFISTTKEDNEIVIDVKDDLTANIILYPSALAENTTLEVTIPAEGNEKEIIT